jgi:outer membrane protein assembly factor BamE (lipoprotein component of BamABCDE complex)
MITSAYPRWATLAFVGAMLLAGCPVPLPPMYDSGSRQNVGERMPDFIVQGETTRDDVLLRLGEPDGRGPGDRWIAYGSSYRTGGVLFIIAVGGGGAAAGVESVRYRRLVVRFDDQGSVTGATFVERVCPSYSLLVSGSEDGQSTPCIDVAVDDAPQSASQAGFGVPHGEHVAAIYENAVWAVTLHGLLNVERRQVPGTLTLTDRSLVFVGKRAAADGSPTMLRIPYAEMTHALPGLMNQILIRLPGDVYQAFEIKEADTPPPGIIESGDVPNFDGSPPKSVVGFITRKIGTR